MDKYSLLLCVGFLLMALGSILNLVFSDFPEWAFSIIHLSATACFAIYLIEYRKNKK